MSSTVYCVEKNSVHDSVYIIEAEANSRAISLNIDIARNLLIDEKTKSDIINAISSSGMLQMLARQLGITQEAINTKIGTLPTNQKYIVEPCSMSPP